MKKLFTSIPVLLALVTCLGAAETKRSLASKPNVVFILADDMGYSDAGCYGGETWGIVDKVLTIDRTGTLRTRSPLEYETGYRHCALRSGAEEWFAPAWLRLPPGDGGVSRERIRLFLQRRIAAQPLQLTNAGSVFRNPPGDHAARLIEACGLKGLERGGARVSEKHANFIVNPNGAARAADIEWLIVAVRATVFEKTGIALVPEGQIVGEA